MAATKLNIPTKSNFVNRPAVPSSQKHNAIEFNQVVAAINSNYERLVLKWEVDIAPNTIIALNQPVEYSGQLWRITEAYNVGNPATWDGAKASPFTVASSEVPSELFTDVDKDITYGTKVWGYKGSGDGNCNLPPLSGDDAEITIINKTTLYSVTLTLDGSDEIWFMGELSGYTLLPGEVIKLKDDGENWTKI